MYTGRNNFIRADIQISLEVFFDTASNRRTNSTQQVHPERIMHPQTVRKHAAFYGTCRFIAMFTSARLLSLSWAKCTWSPRPSPQWFKIHCNIILPSTPMSSKWLLSFSLSTFHEIHERIICDSVWCWLLSHRVNYFFTLLQMCRHEWPLRRMKVFICRSSSCGILRSVDR